MEGPAPVQRYRFGVFTADVRTGELHKHGILVKLQERPFQLLVALMERPGELVSREELRQRLWPEGTFVDFDHSISSAINKLRAVLDDSPTHPRFIETVGGRGYRFLADVKPAPANAGGEEARDETPAVLASTRSRLASQRWAMLLSVAAIAAAVVSGYLWRNSRPRARPANGKVMLAVLPFDNLTGDAGQEYFSDGLTEEMITQLGQLDPQRLGVIARTSVMHYKHSQAPMEQIGRELGVQYVLEGSVRRDSDKVRIAAQLIGVNDQTHLWARQYDRELKDLLLVQGEIAHEISGEIQTAFGDHKPITPKTQPSLSPQGSEAYNLYLQGLYFWNKRTVEGFERAIDYFQQAIAKDPNSARAYAGLADSYILLEEYSGFPKPELIQKGRAAALRALEIDPNLSEAHTAFALIVENFEWDWETAGKEYRRAIELDPNYATAHHWYAEYLMWLGRFDEALRESELARQLDPLSLIIAADNGAILYFSRQYDRAIEKFHYVQAMDPNFPSRSLQAYVAKGMFADAEALLPRTPVNPRHWWMEAYIYGHSGQQARARHALEKLMQWNRRRPVNPIYIVTSYLALGDNDQALAWLEKAYTQHSNMMVSLKVEPAFDLLRNDPRFQDLLHRVGLDR